MSSSPTFNDDVAFNLNIGPTFVTLNSTTFTAFYVFLNNNKSTSRCVKQTFLDVAARQILSFHSLVIFEVASVSARLTSHLAKIGKKKKQWLN